MKVRCGVLVSKVFRGDGRAGGWTKRGFPERGREEFPVPLVFLH